MKKAFTLILAAALLGGTAAHAQSPYAHSVGGYLGSFIGGSYKTFLSGHLAFQGELGFRMANRATLYRDRHTHYFIDFYTFEANPNLMYQAPIETWDFGSLQWFAGGGVSLGTGFQGNGWAEGKLGINAIGGVELAFTAIPLSCQIDFRPGYGQLFGSLTQAYFDYMAGVSVRYIMR